MREKISACVIACNEESNIRRCLNSVKWADEIIVVDSFSKDKTAVIAREYTDLVFHHRWLGYIGQKNLIKDLASGPWILFIDADEEMSPGLKDEIIREFEKGSNTKYAGFLFPRKVWFLGKWITHGDWYPDLKLRLFRKNLGSCKGKEPHDKTTVSGPVKRLQNDLNHYTYNSITDQVRTQNQFSSITAEGMYHDGLSFNISRLIFRPFLRFLRCYFIKLGFLDGIQGFIIAVIVSYGVFVKYAKLWECQLNGKRK